MSSRVVEAVAVKVAFVEIEVPSMLDAKAGSSGENKRQVGVSVAVSIGHASSHEGHGGVEQGFAVQVLGLGQSADEVAELFEGKGVAKRKVLHVIGVAVVVAEFVTGLGNAKLGNGKSSALVAAAEGGDAGGIGLEGQYHQVVNGPEVFPRLSLRNVSIGPLAVGLGDFRAWYVEPGISPLGANLGLAYGSEVLVHSPLVLRSNLFLQLTHFLEVRVEHAALASKGPTLGISTILGFLEKVSEDLLASAHRW